MRRVTGGGPPEAEHLPALEYLDASIRESLRLRPVVPFVVRKTVRPFAVGGREYPAGVVLCPCSYLVHRRSDLYPEPERFRPERFLERKFGPHEWFPFGGGNRVCLGMPFALYEMKVVLAMLFREVRLARPVSARSRPRRYGILRDRMTAPVDGPGSRPASPLEFLGLGLTPISPPCLISVALTGVASQRVAAVFRPRVGSHPSGGRRADDSSRDGDVSDR